jgi:hypothetical protein
MPYLNFKEQLLEISQHFIKSLLDRLLILKYFQTRSQNKMLICLLSLFEKSQRLMQNKTFAKKGSGFAAPPSALRLDKSL